MSKFFDVGWEYYKQMLNIDPSSEARGDYAFLLTMGPPATPSNTAPRDELSLDEPLPENSSRLEASFAGFGMGSQDDVESLTIFNHDSSTLISTGTTSMKRKANTFPGREASISTRTDLVSAPQRAALL